MRITSDLFVSLLVRRLFSAGSFAAVERRGAEAAGAVFVVTRGRGGEIALYGPASQTHADAGGDRRFMREAAADEEALRKRFEREAKFDPDFWVVEIETDRPDEYLDIIEA